MLLIFAVLILILHLTNTQNIRSKSTKANIALPSRPSLADLLPKPDDCEFFDLSNRIYGGNETALEEFPWVVLLEYSKGQAGTDYHCGGSLINNRYVLTAAHCVKGKAIIEKGWSLVRVRLGEWDVQSETDCDDNNECSDPPIDVLIEKKIVHEKYNADENQNYNDIALLRLAEPIKFTKWIKPICLPTILKLRISKFTNDNLHVAGWGLTEYKIRSSVKLKAEIKTFEHSSCKEKYLNQNVNISNAQMCAGGIGGIDTCRGDSGGPLIGIDSSKKQSPYYVLAGIISFGPDPCGFEGWPGVYTRVGYYMDWIEKKILP